MFPLAQTQTPLADIYQFQKPTPQKKQRNPIYQRGTPARRKLTERDIDILLAHNDYETGLTDWQIKHLFFTGLTQFRDRTRWLFDMGFLERSDKRLRSVLPGTVSWLTDAGKQVIEDHREDFARALRTAPLAPRWGRVFHDIACNDVRVSVTVSRRRRPGWKLDRWVASWQFWRDFDTIEFVHKHGAQTKTGRRGVRPDGYFCITRPDRQPSRFLLELDMGTEVHSRLVREKFLAAAAYLKTPAYRKRFGFNAGTWLFVTTSEQRCRNMQQTAVSALGEDCRYFAFTTLDRVVTFPTEGKTNGSRFDVAYHDVLAAPIWYRGTAKTLAGLFRE
jgi:hypothetical protein